MQPAHGSGRVRRRSGGPPAGESLVVPRAELEAALDEITIAYENAVAAADDGLIDFQPFDGLPEAIRILDAALAEEWTS